MKKRGRKLKETIKTEWSMHLAYAVGLLATDGSLSRDGRHIDLTSKDREQIETFRKCLDLTAEAQEKSSGRGRKDAFSVQFSKVLFYRWLVGIGLTPRKSKTIAKLDVPDQYFFDFLRGCFDADGCIYSYWDSRWRSSYMYYVSFVSASPAFLFWLQESIERLADVRGRVTSSPRIQVLRFAKSGGHVILEKMFHANDVPCLQRKFVKAQKILTIDGRHRDAQVEKLVNSLP